LGGSDLTLRNVGLNPTRTAIVDVLRQLGAEVEIPDRRDACNEPIGDLRVIGIEHLVPNRDSGVISGPIIASLIDEIPILGVFGTQIEGGLEIRDAGELRVKESDRIAAVVHNLREMNAEIEEFEDGFKVAKSNLKGARIDSFGDHRIAMAFAVAGLFAKGETEIDGSECVNVSFPGFFETLAQVIQR
jgi:3-phosphoshikimate 1-carboxyvinyltransferase